MKNNYACATLFVWKLPFFFHDKTIFPNGLSHLNTGGCTAVPLWLFDKNRLGEVSRLCPICLTSRLTTFNSVINIKVFMQLSSKTTFFSFFIRTTWNPTVKSFFKTYHQFFRYYNVYLTPLFLTTNYPEPYWSAYTSKQLLFFNRTKKK